MTVSSETGGKWHLRLLVLVVVIGGGGYLGWRQGCGIPHPMKVPIPGYQRLLRQVPASGSIGFRPIKAVEYELLLAVETGSGTKIDGEMAFCFVAGTNVSPWYQIASAELVPCNWLGREALDGFIVNPTDQAMQGWMLANFGNGQACYVTITNSTFGTNAQMWLYHIRPSGWDIRRGQSTNIDTRRK